MLDERSQQPPHVLDNELCNSFMQPLPTQPDPVPACDLPRVLSDQEKAQQLYVCVWVPPSPVPHQSRPTSTAPPHVLALQRCARHQQRQA